MVAVFWKIKGVFLMENDMFYELLQQYKDFQGNVRQCIADLQNKIIELERVNKELTEKLKERNE